MPTGAYSGVPNKRVVQINVLDGKSLNISKCVGPNKHVGWNFLRTLINVQLGSFSENPSKIAIRNKKLEVKVKKKHTIYDKLSHFSSNKHFDIY